MGLLESLKGRKRLIPTLALVAIVLLATWMGYASGGYFLRDWALIFFLLAALTLIASLAGAFRSAGSRWGTVALVLFAGYAAWSLASLLWSPNKGDAWLGASQTLLYLLVFGVAVALLARGSSRRWVLGASVLGPAAIAVYTLITLVPRAGDYFEDNRLIGTVGYYNGEAAFLLVPFWVSIYLGGSRRTDPVLRGLALAAATLSAEIAFLTQSRGALYAMGASFLVFFVLSGQRLRGLLALIPVSLGLLVSTQDLNEVYVAFLNEQSLTAVFDRVVLAAWISTALACLYGIVWGLLDRWWRPQPVFTRVSGAAVLAVCVAVSIFGAVTFAEQLGNPISWSAERWEAFKNDDNAGAEQSRFLASSGTGRYVLWQVTWEAFTANPLVGIGTHNYEAMYYQLRERQVGFVRQPHILPLEVLGERGIIGGALFFGFLTTCLAAGLRQRYASLNAEGKGLVGATIAALAYWFVHSSAEWFWQMPAVTLPAIVYLAVLVAPWNEEPETASARWPLRLTIAVTAVLAASVVAPLYAADRYLERSYATTNPWVALEATQSAQRFNPVDPQPVQREAELRMQIGDWPRVEQAYEIAIDLNPEHYAPYTLLARFYEQRGDASEALSAYREALALNPLDEELQDSVSRLEEEAEETGAPIASPTDAANLTEPNTRSST